MNSLSPKQLGDIVIEETQRAFVFLQDECGYGVPGVRYSHEGMSDDFTALRYESNSTFFEVFYAHMELELSLKIGLLKEKCGYGIEEALRLSGKNVEIPIMTYHQSASSLRSGIGDLASIVRVNLHDALCDPAVILQWEKLWK